VITTSLDDFPSRRETTALETGLRATVIQALASCHHALDLGQDASLAVLSGAGSATPLIHREEARILSPAACSKKRSEFVLGRAAVGYALRELGECSPVLRGGQGEPLWPARIMGSITHCWPWAVALAARSRRSFAIGIDLENLETAARADISSLICTTGELGWVRHGFSFHERLAMIFSAKEAVYKGLYTFFRQYVDFQEVELLWLPERQSFRVSFVDTVQFPQLRGCEVFCRCFAGHVFSCMVYEALGKIVLGTNSEDRLSL
jgi:4'-phosphopantetheinyl transferase EntD